MLLSDVEILKGIECGSILISPFNKDQLGNVSYDLTLGDTWITYKGLYSKDESLKLMHTEKLSDYFTVRKQNKIAIFPGERILAHTREFAGGTGREHAPGVTVTSQLHATSTAARVGLTACMCAGWGDVGYCNRWTLEVMNVSPYAIVLEKGMVICQISFNAVRTPQKLYGVETGNYQQGNDLETLEKSWDPLLHMMPKKLKVKP